MLKSIYVQGVGGDVYSTTKQCQITGISNLSFLRVSAPLTLNGNYEIRSGFIMMQNIFFF
jgi:hypothetical protein